MKQLSIIFFLIILSHCSLVAQYANCSFATEEGVYMKVFLNHQLQNVDPQNHVRLESVEATSYVVLIEILTSEGQLNYNSSLDLQAGFEYNYFLDIEDDQVKLYQANRSIICKLDTVTSIDIIQFIRKENCQSIIKKPFLIEKDLEDFKTYLHSLFTSDRLQPIKDFVGAYNMEASEVAPFIDLLNFSKDQVDFVKFAYDYVCDPQNYYRVIEKMSFGVDKDEVRAFINSKK